MRRMQAVVLSSTLAALSGCGNDGAAPSQVDIMLPPNALLSELTAAESEDLCDELTRAGSERTTMRQHEDCLAQSVSLAQLDLLLGFVDTVDDAVDQCHSSYDNCMQAPVEPDLESFQRECDLVVEMCDVTVNELQGCINTQNRVATKLSSKLDCNRVGDALTVQDQDNIDDLLEEADLACQPLQEGCPQYIDCSEGLGDLPGSWICDGIQDCEDGEDENYC